MRQVVDGRAVDHAAASTSQMSRFETEVLTQPKALTAATTMNRSTGTLIPRRPFRATHPGRTRMFFRRSPKQPTRSRIWRRALSRQGCPTEIPEGRHFHDLFLRWLPFNVRALRSPNIERVTPTLTATFACPAYIAIESVRWHRHRRQAWNSLLEPVSHSDSMKRPCIRIQFIHHTSSCDAQAPSVQAGIRDCRDLGRARPVRR